jgi:IS30 family transposase
VGVPGAVGGGLASRRSTIAERRSIHDRPEAVQERKEAGHGEGDLLICKRTRPVLVLKERKTRFVRKRRLRITLRDC